MRGVNTIAHDSGRTHRNQVRPKNYGTTSRSPQGRAFRINNLQAWISRNSAKIGKIAGQLGKLGLAQVADLAARFIEAAVHRAAQLAHVGAEPSEQGDDQRGRQPGGELRHRQQRITFASEWRRPAAGAWRPWIFAARSAAVRASGGSGSRQELRVQVVEGADVEIQHHLDGPPAGVAGRRHGGGAARRAERGLDRDGQRLRNRHHRRVDEPRRGDAVPHVPGRGGVAGVAGPHVVLHDPRERGVRRDDAVEERLAHRGVVGDVEAEHHHGGQAGPQDLVRRVGVEPEVELRRGRYVPGHARGAAHEDEALHLGREVRARAEHVREVGHGADRHQGDLVGPAFDRVDDELHRVGRPGPDGGEAASVRRAHVGALVEGALERDRPPLRFLAGGPFGGVDEGGPGAEVEGHVARVHQLEQMQHMLGALRDRVVAGDHRDPEHLDPVGPAQQHRERSGVVVEDGRVGIEDDGLGLRNGHRPPPAPHRAAPPAPDEGEAQKRTSTPTCAAPGSAARVGRGRGSEPDIDPHLGPPGVAEAAPDGAVEVEEQRSLRGVERCCPH